MSIDKLKGICPRCGGERVVSRKWKEVTVLYGTEQIIWHEETICQDPKCQKEVEEKLFKEKTKREEIRKGAEERRLGRKKKTQITI